MKTYFVTSDIHSYYSQLVHELNVKGFDLDNDNHILVICGDLFDRGNESLKLYDYINFLSKDRRILIRGNHEYLFLKLMYKDIPDHYDHTNGTVNTFIQLTKDEYNSWCDLVCDKKLKEIQKWILSDEWVNYYETKNYIFTHSFIPLEVNNSFNSITAPIANMVYKENWRDATPKEFEDATWGCPWRLAQAGLNKTGKTIVCGHWHTSDFFNNLKKLKKKYNLYESNPIFVSRKYKIIGLDACTAATNKVNVLVLYEDEL